MRNDDLRREPIRLEPYLSHDYINRAVKMREIEVRMARDEKMRGWRLAAVWAVMGVAALGFWAALWQWVAQP